MDGAQLLSMSSAEVGIFSNSKVTTSHRFGEAAQRVLVLVGGGDVAVRDVAGGASAPGSKMQLLKPSREAATDSIRPS